MLAFRRTSYDLLLSIHNTVFQLVGLYCLYLQLIAILCNLQTFRKDEIVESELAFLMISARLCYALGNTFTLGVINEFQPSKSAVGLYRSGV